MQPGCIKRLIKSVPFEDRIGYSAKILGIMVEEGTQGMGEEQKQTFRTNLQAIIDSGF